MTKQTKEKAIVSIFLILFMLVGLIVVLLINKKFIEQPTPIQQPVAKVSMADDLFSEKEKISATVYGYSSDPAQTDDTPCITASGYNICGEHKNIVANNCLPFGTKVIIDGMVYDVEDRMAKRYGCDVYDLLFDSRDEAINWGKRYLEIIIIK